MFGLFNLFGFGLYHGYSQFAEQINQNFFSTPELAMQANFVRGAAFGMKNYWFIAVMGASIWFLVAFFMHQRLINKATGAHSVTRMEEPKIYNILENLCISRGLAMPRFYIIESEVMNAYASGISPKSYAVTLSRGLINNLNDDELEAVIAHELTHIINRDVRLLIIAVVFVGIFSFLAEMSWRSMRVGSFSRNSRGSMPFMLVAGVVLMIGYGLALVIRFTLSRKREYMADAGAVELTKKPEAMVNSLRRIAGNAKMANVPPEVAQMFIENPASFSSMFATHPPIEKRIRVLMEIFDVKESDLIEIPETSEKPRKMPWDFFRKNRS